MMIEMLFSTALRGLRDCGRVPLNVTNPRREKEEGVYSQSGLLDRAVLEESTSRVP